MIRPVLFAALVALPVQAQTVVPTSQAQISLSFAPLVKQAAPAVVNIYVSRVVERNISPFADDPIFSQLFRDFGQTRPEVQNSLGSGVILSADGIVVSNYHVVGQATDIKVVQNDGRQYDAEVLLADQDSDLAILQLAGASGLPHLNLRPSDTVEVGELVLAIGNPFGVGQTVSSGIVSGLARSGTATGNARGYFIQTDAPINPGNSGGALIDVNGDLIGINTSILSRSGGSNGIGFAIPASLVEQFVAQARGGKDRFQRPWAGMSGQPVDADLAETFGQNIPTGMVITDLHPDSPFSTAGFEVGDVITAVDGQPVNTPAEMIYRMTVAGLGSTAQITRLRGASQADVAVQMVAPPDKPARDPHVLTDAEVLSGMRVENLNPAVIAEYGLPLSFVDAGKVIVTDEGPIAPRIGLATGDILISINGSEVNSAADVGPLFESSGRRVEVQAYRGGQRMILRFRR